MLVNMFSLTLSPSMAVITVLFGILTMNAHCFVMISEPEPVYFFRKDIGERRLLRTAGTARSGSRTGSLLRLQRADIDRMSCIQ
jgi:hypothetical protein